MASFGGFGEKALPFLSALAFHQDRDWFAENRDLYESEVRGPLGDLVEAASERLAGLGIPLNGSRKASIFRVNRDVRFSKDKHPYNSHASAVLTRNGTKKDAGGGYIHIKPGDCYIGAGLWMADKPVLTAIRTELATEPDRFRKIVTKLAQKGLQLSQEDALKRVPPDFTNVEDKDVRDWMRLKHFFANQTISDDAITSPAFLDTFVDHVATCRDLLDWGFAHLDGAQ